MIELAEQILNLRAGDHLCLFYEKDPAEQMPALTPFIQEALSRDEQFIYIADDQTAATLLLSVAKRLERPTSPALRFRATPPQRSSPS